MAKNWKFVAKPVQPSQDASELHWTDANGERVTTGAIRTQAAIKKGKQSLQDVMQAKLPPETLMDELWDLFRECRDAHKYGIALNTLSVMAAYAYGKPTKHIEVEHSTRTILETWLQDRRPIVLEEPDIVDVQAIEDKGEAA